MFNSLLNAVSVDSLILDVFIILAVVVACALVVYFLWEGISSMLNKDKKPAKELDLGKKKEKPSNVVAYDLDKQQEKIEVVEDVKAVETQPSQQSLIEEENLEDVDDAKAEEEKAAAEAEVSDEERANAERRAYLEARRQELIRRMQQEMEEDAEEAEETVESETVSEDVEENAEVVEEQAEEVESQVEETEVVDTLAEEREALAAEKAKYETMVRELETAKKALAEQKQETVTVEVPVVVPTNGALSLDELKARLAAAEEKLAATEKEFRACKKEYSPLRRVWTTHERDEKKLRRKEALVAKQKVVLYGVNNYADIDEEKAKKLAEDLDLLDGLKLSVQHCEEVMKKNAERYPLLEKMFNVLKARNEELRADIAYYKQEISKLEEEQNA